MLLCFSDGPLTRAVTELGVRVYILNSKFRMRSPLRFLRALRELRFLIDDIAPDLIHSTMPYSHLMVGLVRILYGIKVPEVWFQHGPVGGRLDRFASLFWTDRLFVNSEFTKKAHLESSSHRFGGIDLIPLAVMDEKVVAIERELPIKRVGFAGRICSWKGAHVFLEAIELIKVKWPSVYQKLEFSLCGSALVDTDRSYEQALKARVSAAELGERVCFLGYQSNMSDYYNQLDLLVHPSVIPEPFGLVVGEAMAHRTLIIGQGVGGVSDLVKEGITALCFDGSALSLAQKIVAATEMSAEEISSYLDNAYALVSRTYTTRSMINKIEDCYQNLF